jgi:hypothetical protein
LSGSAPESPHLEHHPIAAARLFTALGLNVAVLDVLTRARAALATAEQPAEQQTATTPALTT